MIIAHMSYEMYSGRTDNSTGYLGGIQIPASINDDGVLVIGHNGESQSHNRFSDFSNINANDFKFFDNHLYRGASQPTAQYLRNGIPYELMSVRQAANMGGKLLYTFLTPCRDGTYFCKCKDCGKNFVVDCYESPHYLANALTVPTVRCRDCINIRKNRNR